METKHQELKKILGERLKENEPLAPYTTFKIGGAADLFYEARLVDELVYAVRAARKLNVSVFILGGGSNILIGDKGVRGLVIKNSTGKITIRGAKGALRGGTSRGLVYIEVDSGVIMNKLVRFTIEAGLGGLEMHLGLPGTVGGALFLNSKWTRPEGYVGDAVYQASLLCPDDQVVTVPKSYFQFGYDSSVIQRTKDIVLSVVFVLRQEDQETLWEVAEKSINYRKVSQPQGIFSPGCTFKNITQAQALAAATPNQTTSAGFLVDHAGLKGLAVGEVQVSPVHANFIINKGRASASDVVKLIELCRSRVKDRFGVTLTEEIVRVGEF